MTETITLTVPVEPTARTTLLEGMFDIEHKATRSTVIARLPIEQVLANKWNIGLIVGPSGSGKTQAARAAYNSDLWANHKWTENRAVVDEMPADCPLKEIVEVLSSVGFSSPPAWLRPFHTLSNGEQFRVGIARGLLENKEVLVVDEFTSVVDRNVAQIASHATQKVIRKRKQQMVAISCHYDIVEWLQPDWLFDTGTGCISWRLVQPRPQVTATITRGQQQDWAAFSRHHYLSASLAKSARIITASVNGQPAAFCAVMSLHSGTLRDAYRVHRIVTTPDFQGIGIGNALLNGVAGALVACDKKAYITTSHPGLVSTLNKSQLWALTRRPSRTSAHSDLSMKAAASRNTAGFRYVGQADYEIAKLLVGGSLATKQTSVN
jgi:hypothetical protein